MMARLQVFGANILITSREHVYDHLTTSGLFNVQRIDIRADPEDLAKYVEGCMQKQTRLANIVRKEPSLRQDIVNTIVGSCDGMFLVARLQIESLRKHTNAASLHASLRALPTTIHGFYDEAMHRIETDERSEDALSVLSCLVYARRPLQVEELQHFLAIRPGLADLQEAHLTTRDTLISMCAGLVVVDDGTGIIRLVHLTTQEYFKQRREARFPWGDEEMGRKCLAYLCLDAVRNFDCMIASLPSDPPVKMHVLLDYIVEYWRFHVLPHQNALREFLLSNPNFDVRNMDGWTPLMYASQECYESAVKFLLDNNVDVNARGGYKESTALIEASSEGHRAVVELLLDRGANIEAQEENGTTALMWASMEGHSAVVQFLLERGANIEAQDEDGATALMNASYIGHDAVVKILLERGANTETQDEDGATALLWASKEGQSAVVEVLLEHGANDEVQDNDGKTALILANESKQREAKRVKREAKRLGYDATIKLLTERANARQ
ncbi:ankyrin repeat-containing domain protein [Mycena crocata]|nr:ankyrin repeat-containing domain protein [Mycena crocata]